MSRAILSVVLLIAGSASAQGFTKDELCQAIGDTADRVVQPRDRIFFQKNCFCFDGTCAHFTSRKGRALIKAKLAHERAEADERRRSAEADKKERAEHTRNLPILTAAAKKANQEMWGCVNSPAPDCKPQIESLHSACEALARFGEAVSVKECELPEFGKAE